ncbi:MAG: hypothetical protein QXP59_07080 [Saccharolobus sp.]
MKTLKLQTTFEFSNLQIMLIIITIIAVGFFMYYYSAISNSIQNENIYTLTNIYFYPAPGQSSNIPNTYGNFQISLFASKITDLSNSYLIQAMPNIPGFKTNCNIPGVSAFNSNSFYCIALGPQTSELPEGNGQYLLSFDNAYYNTTAYNIMNQTENLSIKYFVVYQNGRYAVDKLEQPLAIQIS